LLIIVEIAIKPSKNVVEVAAVGFAVPSLAAL
jgi:hypothetical protein